MAEIADGAPKVIGRDFYLGDRHVCDETCPVGVFAFGGHIPKGWRPWGLIDPSGEQS